MFNKSIKNVLVIGATGSVGPAIVKALLAHPQGYVVSVLTRPQSLEKARGMFPDTRVKIFAANYSELSVEPGTFKPSFENQDAIVSATATFTVSQQKAIIDAAIATKTVQRFIPSEYGIDTSDTDLLREYIPVALLKREVVRYLDDHESAMSWSAICTGAFFDWGLQIPGNFGWTVSARKAMIFGDGNTPFEATNIGQIGAAIAAALSSVPSPGFADGDGAGLPMFRLTANKYVYVNSFTTTQNEVLSLLEKHTKESFEVQHLDLAEVAESGKARSAKSVPDFRPTTNLQYPDGTAESIWAAIYGHGNINHYSKTKGLWNEALGLRPGDLEESVKGVVAYWQSQPDPQLLK